MFECVLCKYINNDIRNIISCYLRVEVKVSTTHNAYYNSKLFLGLHIHIHRQISNGRIKQYVKSMCKMDNAKSSYVSYFFLQAQILQHILFLCFIHWAELNESALRPSPLPLRITRHWIDLVSLFSWTHLNASLALSAILLVDQSAHIVDTHSSLFMLILGRART